MSQKGFSLIIILIGLTLVFLTGLIAFILTKNDNSRIFQNNQAINSKKVLDTNNKIAFVRDGLIWLADPDGNNQLPIISKQERKKVISGFDGSLIWSPDNTKIAFTSSSKTNCSFGSGCAEDLFYFDFKTNKVNKIPTPDDNGINFLKYPITWAPDSNRYVLVSYDNHLVVGDIATGKQVVIYNASTNKVGIDPVLWSPKGEKILLTENLVGNDGDAVVINPEGKVLKRIKASEIGLKDADITAIWGRDDNEIILSEHGTRKLKIHLVKLDGSDDMKDITTGEGYNFGYSKPVVSPKGSYIAVYHVTGQTFQPSNIEISIVKLDGTIVKENITQGIPKEYFDNLVWSPNEDAVTIEVNQGTVWTVTLDGNYKKVLDNARYPTWSFSL